MKLYIYFYYLTFVLTSLLLRSNSLIKMDVRSITHWVNPWWGFNVTHVCRYPLHSLHASLNHSNILNWALLAPTHFLARSLFNRESLEGRESV